MPEKHSEENWINNSVSKEDPYDSSDLASPMTTLFKANVTDNLLFVYIGKIEPDLY